DEAAVRDAGREGGVMTHSLEPSFPIPEPSSKSTWSWRLEDSSGAEKADAPGAGQSFPSQSDAESWLGEEWRDLVDDGVDQVRLFEGDREVYGPMSLHTT
ncbi:MAG: hypothetical protein ACRDPI_09945, partial [Nocardioidaceae bacterium]